MLKRSTPLRISAVLLLLLALPVLAACNPEQPAATIPPGAIETAAAQTIAVDMQQRTIDALQVLLTSQAMTIAAPTATLAPSSTPLPTETPAPTAVPPTAEPPSPVPPTPVPPSPTSSVPLLIANVDTRCRKGPSTTFDVLSYILVGQKAEVLGRNPERTWWLIRDPLGQYGSCWVWAETTQLLGDPGRVAVVEPPASPTPSNLLAYGLTYSNIHNCGGVAVAVFKVVNTGSATLQSSSITIMDITHDTGLSGPESSNSPFMKRSSSCPPGNASLLPGETAYLGKAMGILPASGTRGRGIIVLCTKPGLDGKCLENRTTFTFP